jgi:hypothetical protein
VGREASGYGAADFGQEVVIGLRTTLFCVGAQKAGTTWLYDVLRRHPEVSFPPMKELHFWSDLYGDGKWRRRFLGRARRPPRLVRLLEIETDADYGAYLGECAGDSPVSGDLSPDYAMLPPDAFRRMEAAAPDARFLFVMRDPVDRYWSWIKMRAARFDRDLAAMTRNRIEALVAEGYAGTRADYGATITSLREAGLANVRLMLFEDLMAEQRRHITDLLDYLRIAPQINSDMAEAMAGVSRKGSDAELPPEAADELRLALDGVYRDVAALGIDARHRWRY